MMSRNDEEQLDADAVAGAGKFFQTVQPQRDLESNWAVDLAKNLEEYLLKICSGEISGDDGSHLSVNFAEAALLLQGSIQVYSRKVEYLYSLVLHALEFISQKSQQEQTPGGESDQPAESGPNAAVSEENDSFWGLDDIPVDAKNLLDSATVKETTLNHFVRPPANLVVLEGDCLDANGDAGELETYLLANNDLYRDFILLDSCDAVVVNAFLDGDYKAGKGQSTACRGSSLTSKGCKSFQSPIRRSGSVMLSVGKNKNDASNLSPQFNDGCEFNDRKDGSFPPAYDSPDNNNHEFGMEDGYINSTDSDDSEDDDPWKPLNPHEPGNLKIKPYKRVKANRRRDVGSKKHIFITTEFPLARLHGMISSELNQIWETRRRALGGENQSKSPPLYEKLRQSLTDAGNIDHDAFGNSMDKNENNGYDSDDPDIGPPDFDMPGMDEDLPSNSDENNNGDIHFDNTEAYGDPNAHTNLEDLCRSHLDALLASISETQKQTEMAARVSTWKQRIEQNLEEQDARPPFDIHEYGERVLDKLSSGQDSGNSTSFADVVRGQEKHDVARTFSALLQLVNNRDVDLERVGSGRESTCYTAVNPFYVRFLRHEKKRDDNVKLQLSKKRAKSPMMKGHGRGEKNKPGKENQPVFDLSPSRTNSTCRFSLKVGKSGGIRCTPEGKKRRKSRLIEPVDLHSVE